MLLGKGNTERICKNPTMPRRIPKRRVKRASVSKASVNFKTALGRLRRLKPHHQCEAMKVANNDFIKQMCLHVKKLRHKPNLNRKQREGLHRYAPKLRTLASNRVSLKKKRDVLSQRGGFLPMLAPLLMSVAGPIMRGLASVFK